MLLHHNQCCSLIWSISILISLWQASTAFHVVQGLLAVDRSPSFRRHNHPNNERQYCLRELSLRFVSRPSSSCLAASPEDTRNDQTEDTTTFTMQATYDGRTVEVPIRDTSEPILSALERTSSRLGVSTLPFDCRRGNCMTCAGRHLPESVRDHLQPLDDSNSNIAGGLSPQVAEFLQEQGYVLTCSSRIVGDGVRLELAENHNAWMSVYQERLDSQELRDLGRQAMAKAIRKNNERNQEKWRRATEQIIQKEDSQL